MLYYFDFKKLSSSEYELVEISKQSYEDHGWGKLGSGNMNTILFDLDTSKEYWAYISPEYSCWADWSDRCSGECGVRLVPIRKTRNKVFNLKYKDGAWMTSYVTTDIEFDHKERV